MKFTKKQELVLIGIGLSTVLSGLVTPAKKKKKAVTQKPVWSVARRKKFSQTMKKKWAEKNKK